MPKLIFEAAGADAAVRSAERVSQSLDRVGETMLHTVGHAHSLGQAMEHLSSRRVLGAVAGFGISGAMFTAESATAGGNPATSGGILGSVAEGASAAGVNGLIQGVISGGVRGGMRGGLAGAGIGAAIGLASGVYDYKQAKEKETEYFYHSTDFVHQGRSSDWFSTIQNTIHDALITDRTLRDFDEIAESDLTIKQRKELRQEYRQLSKQYTVDRRKESVTAKQRQAWRKEQEVHFGW